MPNTRLATTAVTNRMSNEQSRISSVSDVGYDDELDTAADIRLSVANDTILGDPKSSAHITDLANNAVLPQSWFWVSDPDREELLQSASWK